MKSLIKSSQKPDIAQAAAEATAGVFDPKGIIFLSDYARLPLFARELAELFPNADIIGTAGTAYHEQTADDTNILVVTAILGEAEVSAGLIGNLSTDPLSELYKLSESVKAVSPQPDSTVCIEFCTGNEEVLVSTMNIALEPVGVGLAGGTVYGAPEGRPSLVAYNGKVYEDACAYIVVKNTTGKAYVVRENIYDKADGPVHLATKVNTAKKELTELDHRPAADVYSAETGVARDKIVDNVLKAPFGRIINGEIYISSMNGVLQNGAITNYKRINVNDSLYILKLKDYRAINEETRRHIRSLVAEPSMIFSVNCIYRYLLFEKDGYLKEFLTNMSRIAPFAGYIGGGEQYNRQHVNQTMVCAVFE